MNSAFDAEIVILSLDRTDDTIDAIASALSQTGVRRRVIVVDQGSAPDGLARIASRLEGEPDTTLIRLGHNVGVAAGRNAGAAAGDAPIIVGLDNDAVFDDATTLARLVAAFEDAPDLAAVGVRIVVDSTGADDLSSWGYPRALLSRAAQTFETATFVGAGHAIRRTAWDRAGGYDPALFFTWEEYDFCLRAIGLGWRIAYRGDIVVRHRVSPEHRVSWSGSRLLYFVRNRLHIERKWGASWVSMAPRIAGYAVRGARHGLLGQALRGVVAAVRMPDGERHAMPEAGRTYLARVDTAYRGPVMDRVRREVLAPLGH